MKTIITQPIDGYDIIQSIGKIDGLIDPEATIPIVNKILQETQTFKDAVAIKAEIKKYTYQAVQSLNSAKAAQKSGNKSDLDKHSADYRFRLDQIKDCEERLKPLAEAFTKERAELIVKHAEYFTPAPGEFIVEDEIADAAAEALADALMDGKLIDKDLNIIENNKGIQYWKKSDKWYKFEIFKIGEKVPKGGIIEKDLTEAQRAEITTQVETERISKLSAAEKSAEKENVIKSLTQQAVNMRSSLEIEGVKSADALSQAQNWLAVETGKVEIKYS